MIHQTGKNLLSGRRLPMAVRRAGARRPTDQVIADIVKVIFVTAGEALLHVADVTLAVKAGSIVTVPADTCSSAVPLGYVEAVTFFLHDEFLRSQLQWLPISHPIVYQAEIGIHQGRVPEAVHVGEVGLLRLRPLLSALLRLDDMQDAEFARLARLADLFGEVSALRAGTDEEKLLRTPSTQQQIARAVTLLREQPNHRWTVVELAGRVSMSASQLTRLFGRDLGVSPAAFLWRLRLDRMAELLIETDLTVAQAAICTGWTSTTAASRAFKRRYGVSPKLFGSLGGSRLDGARNLQRTG